MEGEFPEDMHCPICFEIPIGTIYQCRNGHLVCQKCSIKLQHCPQCSVRLETPRIRSLGVEQLLDKVKYNCQYRSKGCAQKLIRNYLECHNKNCLFGGEQLHLCKLVGLKCYYSFNTRAIAAGSKHLQTNHNVNLVYNKEIAINILNFNSCVPTLQTGHWILACIQMTQRLDVNAGVFIVLMQYMSEDRSVSFCCLSIRENPNMNILDTHVKFVIESQDSNKGKDIVWTTPTVSMVHATTTYEQANLRTPLEVLQEYSKNGILTVKLMLFKDEDRIPKHQNLHFVAVNLHLPATSGPTYNPTLTKTSSSKRQRLIAIKVTAPSTAL